jgi:hypothetical protein
MQSGGDWLQAAAIYCSLHMKDSNLRNSYPHGMCSLADLTLERCVGMDEDSGCRGDQLRQCWRLEIWAGAL